MDELNPGDVFLTTRQDIEHAVVLLSSDIEPGYQNFEHDLFRCAEFQILPNNRMCGAQIVLYTEPEIRNMKKISPIMFEGNNAGNNPV